MTTPQKQQAYDAANQAAARIVVADVVKYPPDSLLGVWARMILQRQDEAGKNGEGTDGQ
jgi:hypothetical protein